MKRRDVIKLGAVAAGVGAGVPGCSLPKPIADMQGATGADEFNAMLDAQLAKLEGPGLLGRLVSTHLKTDGLTTKQTEAIGEKDALFRKMLSTVLITQAFRELPEETQVQPSVQARIWSHYDQLGSTMFEVADALAALSEDERDNLRETLDQNPDFAMDLGEALDARAARAGISKARRRALRKMMSQTTFRLRKGHVTAIVDEYVEKIDKLRVTDERHAKTIDIARQINERAFWDHQHRLANDPPPITTTAPPATQAAPLPPPQPNYETLRYAARNASNRGDCDTVAALALRVQELDPIYFREVFSVDPVITSCVQRVEKKPAPAPPPPKRAVKKSAACQTAWGPVACVGPTPQPPGTRRDKPGEGGLRAGGYMMLIGLGLGVVGGLIVSAGEFAGLFVLTFAALFLAIGFIVVLFSAIIAAANS